MADRDRLLAAIHGALPGATTDEIVALLRSGSAGRNSAGADLSRNIRDLGERVKELSAFHQVASLLNNGTLTEETILSRVAAVLPQAFLHPGDAAARVIHGQSSQATPGFAESPWLLRSRFTTSEGAEGSIEVAYLHEHPPEAEGPFLAEERRLLDSLAAMIATSLERRRMSERLRLLVNTGRLRMFEYDVASNRVVWPGILDPDPSAAPHALSMSREAALEHIHADDRDSLIRILDEALDGPAMRDEFSIVFRAAFSGVEFRWRHLTGRVIRDPGGHASRLIGISADITEQRLLQDRLRQGQKMEALGSLAGSVAHDFNNILTTIMGFSELAVDAVDPKSAVRTHLREISRAGESATALVKQILAFGRRQELRPSVVDLYALVVESKSMLGRLLGKRVSIWCAPPAEESKALVDPHQFHQVVLNLTVNARDAMPDGGTISLRVGTRRCPLPRSDGLHDAPRDWATLEVEDTGCGMPSEVRERIFEPFFTTKEEGKGTGLGLATVHGIVTQSGGFVEVESEVGRGTLFRAHFPVGA